MTYVSRRLSGVAAVAMFVLAGQIASAETLRPPISANELADVLQGKICTSAGGAKFTFTDDGHYAYDGMWTNRGHYSIDHGRIFVIFDSGLARFFAISRKGDVLYMEKTAVSCAPAPVQAAVMR